MDDGLCLSKEHGGVIGDGDSRILEIEKSGVIYRPYDQWKDYGQVCGIIWDFYLKQYGEDLSEWTEIDVGGVKRPIQRVECVLAHYLEEKCKIQLAFVDGEIAGILIYNSIYDCILGVRILEIDEKFQKRGIAKTLINSLDFEVKKLVFQYYKPKPPVDMLRHTEGRRKIITETDKLITCEMQWGSL